MRSLLTAGRGYAQMADFFEAADALRALHQWLHAVVQYLKPLYSDGVNYSDERADSVEHAWSSTPVATHYLKVRPFMTR